MPETLRRGAVPRVAAAAFFFACSVLPALLLPGRAAHALVPVKSRGVFTDRDGAKHTWHINAGHTLFWDDKPFVPVGGLFQAKYWAPNATELDYGDDLAALQALKQKGVTDVFLQAPRVGLTGVKPERVQKIIDALEAEGFTYGLSIADGPREPLMGHIIRPGAFRQTVPEGGGNLRFAAQNLAGGLYFLVTPSGEVLESGDVSLVSEGARVSAPPPTGGERIVFVVPEYMHLPGTPGARPLGMVNFWEGFDGYRDSLIGFFSQVKLGKGFRFFVDPLPADLTLSAEFDNLLPSSQAFQTEWAAWLGKRYKNVDTLMTAWAVGERDVADFAAAADQMPLWSGGKGIEYFYEKRTGRQRKANAVRSQFWRDLSEFKAESVRGYMNDLAVVLKKAVADVPVVYRSRGWSPLFARLRPDRGFDGFGIEAYGRGSDLATRTAAYVLAQASEQPKTIWLPVISTADSVSASRKETPGYASRFALHSDLDWLREIGGRGFYVSGVRVADPTRQAFDLLQTPEQLGWLKDYADILTTAGVRAGSAASLETAPPVIYYPKLQLASLSPVPLKSGGWWLPTERIGQIFDFGPAGRAYSLDEAGVGVVYYLWNPTGPRRIQIKLPKAATDKNALSRPAWSASANGEVKGDTLTMTIGPEPVRLLNMPGLPVPVEAWAEMMAEAQALVKLAQQQKRVDAGRWQQEVGTVRYRESAPYDSVIDLQRFLERFRASVRPYLWLEAENADAGHSYDEIEQMPGASGYGVLTVGDRAAASGGDPNNAPVAKYRLSWADSRPVQVWISASQGAKLSLSVDGQSLIDEATLPQPVGSPYADSKLVWYRVGTATIPKGNHVLEVRADNAASIDTLLFTRSEFTPAGPTPPPVLTVDEINKLNGKK